MVSDFGLLAHVNSKGGRWEASYIVKEVALFELPRPWNFITLSWLL